ncbi:MAG TPA: ATP-dependent zinc metalloprotease FtsH [Candidatus Dormibacteraeota bacterium]|nr:ATP-dependent zinc metalloprotease FtsH [Candidatus Dormibacteraeota bacterium]HEV2475489.1 ATP-dependent zinc metalloprotease FtsH [Candidatus Dormibacteraeota bacterium]
MGQNPPPAKPATPPAGASPQKPPDMLAPMRTRRFWIVLGVLLLVNIVVGQVFTALSQTPTVTISYNTFLTQVADHNVSSITSTGESINGVTKKPVADFQNGTTSTKFQTQRPAFANDDLLTLLQNSNVVINAKDPNAATPLWETLLFSFGPTILLVLGFLYLSRRAASAGAGGILGSFGQSRARLYDAERPAVTFDDVAGIDEVKADLQEIVDFLREPQKYTKLGGAAPKGVLLIGAPGTGKTLLARAVAGEAKVPFFSISGSEFVEAIVGVGASRVRDLFAKARAAAPAIIFIDEIDAIGRSRSAAVRIGGNDEQEQTLNQILTEMDGFDSREGVIVLAATNRADVLDPALLRPGRFDRRISVQPPDRRGRAAILRIHTRTVPLGPDVNLDEIAGQTPGLVGADLKNLVNEAALTAARKGESTVTAADFQDAIEKTLLGSERKLLLSDADRERIAYHESGHALLGLLVPGADPVKKVTIVPRGQALGVTLQSPVDDRFNYGEDYLRARMIGALGGRAAERLVYGVVTTGAENDLQQVTRIAHEMVVRWGMSPKVGPLNFSDGDANSLQKPYSEATGQLIDDEIRRIAEECLVDAEKLLTEHRPQLDALAKALLKSDSLDEPQILQVTGISSRPVAAVVGSS